jgi:hypothetical protein
MKYRYLGLSCAALILLGAAFSFAQQTEQTPPEKPGEKAAGKPKERKKTPAPPEDKVVQTKHSASAGRRSSTRRRRDDRNENGGRYAEGEAFYRRTRGMTSARRCEAADHVYVQWRPGSSSVWLHLGAFGPRRGDGETLERPAPL